MEKEVKNTNTTKCSIVCCWISIVTVLLVVLFCLFMFSLIRSAEDGFGVLISSGFAIFFGLIIACEAGG